MASPGSVTVRILGDPSHFERAVDSIDGQVSRMGSAFKRLAGAAAAAFAGVQVVQFAKDTVGAASALQESLGKSNVVFGEQAKEIEKWAGAAAKGFGQSKQQALEAAGTYGNLFQAFGVGRDESAKMSKSMVELAADLASFNNTSVDDALLALRSGLSGETEPLKRFGVAINDARLKEEALRMGLIKTTKDALTPGAKAQAAYALIMKDTTLAQGDFARTSDGLANKQRILAARMEDLKAKIGTALLPVVSALTGAISDGLFPAFEKVSAIVRQVTGVIFKGDFKGGPFAEDSKFVDVLFRIREAFQKVAGVAEQVIGVLFKGDFKGGPFEEDSRLIAGLFRLREVMQRVADFVKDNLKPILIGLGVAVAFLVAPFVSVAAALVFAYIKFETFQEVVNGVVRFLVDTVLPVIVQVSTYLVEQFGNAVEWVKKMWPQISEAVGHVMRVVSEVIGVYIDIVKTLWRAWGDDLFRLAKVAFEYIRNTIDNVLQVIRGVIQTVLALINGDWGKAWDGIKQILAGAWDQITNVIQTAVDTVRGILGGLASTVSELAKGLWDPIREGFKSAINWIIRAWNGLEFKIPGFDPPGPGPKFGGFTLGVPDIPELADGGVVRARPGGTLARIGEGRYDEAVIPLKPGMEFVGGNTYHLHIDGNVYGVDDLDRRFDRFAGELTRLIGAR
ncbi:MAG: hypothetical protein AB7L84_09800 [Acidimicrobiia bacterium]